MSKIKELLKSKEFHWFTIFFRDICLILVIAYVNYATHYRSWWAAFIFGMIAVWISWQFTDYLNYKRIQKLTWK